MDKNYYQFDAREENVKKVDANKPKKTGLFAYILLGFILFSGFFVVTNWPSFKVIVDYHLQKIDTNVFKTTDPNNENVAPLQTLQSANEPEDKINVKLDIAVTSPDNRLVIPSLGLSVPIQKIPYEEAYQDDESLLNNVIQSALRDGVVLYPGTADPGKRGNSFITGHSSYYLWDPGVYKDVFAVLPKIQDGAEIIVYFNQKEYLYKVSSTKEVWPDQVDVLNQTNDYRLTLMTCTPIGTNLKRFIVVAELQAS